MCMLIQNMMKLTKHRPLLIFAIKHLNKTCAPFHVSSNRQAFAHRLGETVDIKGNTYKTDSLTNVTPAVLSKVGRNIHQKHGHPLNLIYKRIEHYLHSTYINRRGNPVFTVFNNLNPVVSHEQNFDSLLVAPDHISRSPSDTYYINSEYMLRSHTSAHERDLIRSGLDAFAFVGDCYRRDEIDTTHYPVFHQLEISRYYSGFELFANVKDESDLSLFEDGKHTESKQPKHTLEAVKLLEYELKNCIEGLMRSLFGQDLQMKWVDAYFPWTHPSWELEIFHQGDWIEMLGCGIMSQRIVDNAGATNKASWAAGLGMERLAMKLYNIPDIRLFWSEDSGFLHQFQGKKFNEKISYKEISKYPQCINDISFWISKEFTSNDFYDLVRSTAGDLVEQVSLIDEFLHPKTDRMSHCYRLVYRHMERTLTKEEVNEIHKEVEMRAVKDLNVEIR